MAIGTAICPTCGARFSVDSDMAMQHVQCPNCGEDIFLEGVDGPASAGTGEAGSSTAKGASPVSDGETSHYRWGRLFIRMVRWIAILVLAVGVFRMAECWLKMQREIQLARERLPSSTEVRHLAEAQQALVESYDDMVGVLTLSKEGVPKFGIGAELSTGGFVFNEELDSTSDVEESLEELGNLKENVREIKRIFNDTLQRYAPKARASASSSSSSPSHTHARAKTSSRRTTFRSSGASQYRFYTPSAEPQRRDDLQLAIGLAREMSRNGEASTNDKLEPLLKHILSVFFPSFIEYSVGNGPESAPSRDLPQRPAEPAINAKVVRLLGLLLRLQEGWAIENLIAEVENGLDDFRRRHRICAEETKDAMARCAGGIFSAIVAHLAVALGCLVFADYLRAHFDMADSLKLREGI